MKAALKRLIAPVLLGAALLLTLLGLEDILVPKFHLRNCEWPTTATYRQFYRMEPNSLDVLFLGSSVCVNGFSPQVLYDEFQLRSYNLGSEQQSIPMSYFWLEEALRFQSPKAVVLDVRFCFPYEDIQLETNMSEAMVRKCIDPMHWSRVKMQAVRDICIMDPGQTQLSYYITSLRFHSRWSELTKEDFHIEQTDIMPYYGFSPRVYKSQYEFQPLFLQDGEAREPMLPVMKQYLDKIVETCSREQIPLVLVGVPELLPREGAHNTVQAYADEHGLQFYDFAELGLYEQLEVNSPLIVPIDHSSVWGAGRLTGCIGRILCEEYGLQGTEDPRYEATSQGYADFLQESEEKLKKLPD